MAAGMSEFSEQCAIIAWARMNEQHYPCLRWLHCSLNGVKLTKGQAIKAKAAGMTAGIPDLFLPYPFKGWAGLYIELKVGRNQMTPEQYEFIMWARENGYCAQVARGFDQAVALIEDYLFVPGEKGP